MKICRVCAVEHQISRRKRWVSMSHCPLCDEAHALFAVLPSDLDKATWLLELKRRLDVVKQSAASDCIPAGS